MRMMITTNPQDIHGMRWNLPGVKDLLSRVELKQTPPLRPQPGIDIACPSLRQASESSRPRGNPRTYGLAEKHLLHYPSLRSLPHSSDRSPYGQEVDKISSHPSPPERRFSQDFYIAIKSEPQMKSPPDALKATDILHANFQVHPSLRPLRRTCPVVSAPTSPHLKLQGSPYGSSSGRVASNDRHKLSEKHRRDDMGVFVQAAELLRKDLNPGILSGCTICIDESDIHGDNAPSFIFSENGNTSGGIAAKKTKNDMLRESVMWEFSMALHLWPAELGKHLDGIRTLAIQMAQEREFGLRNDFAKSGKWAADVRAKTLEELLQTMEGECERHGVAAWNRGDQSPIMTPPASSSTTSPLLGQKRLREASEGSENSDRVVKQKQEIRSATT